MFHTAHTNIRRGCRWGGLTATAREQAWPFCRWGSTTVTLETTQTVSDLLVGVAGRRIRGIGPGPRPGKGGIGMVLILSKGCARVKRKQCEVQTSLPGPIENCRQDFPKRCTWGYHRLQCPGLTKRKGLQSSHPSSHACNFPIKAIGPSWHEPRGPIEIQHPISLHMVSS